MPTLLALKYAGRTLTFDPVNIDIVTIGRKLKQGLTVHTILEPGDATRYDLLISIVPPVHLRALGFDPDQPHLLVTRIAGGECAAAIILPPFSIWNVRDISHDNEWSATFLSHWLQQLWEELTCLL